MPATAADIAAASRDAAIATWSDAGIGSRYPSARDGSVTPATGFFDASGDAQTVIDARGALIGIERRRFTVGVDDLLWPAISTGLPQVQLIDGEQAVSATFLAARIEIDLEAETTSYELFG
jgi:hypothetical protein